MESYVERVKGDAETLAKEVFPRKALELDELVNSKLLDTKNLFTVFDEKDFPTTEDFVNTAANSDKENVEDLNASKKRKLEYRNDGADVFGCKIILFPNGSVPSNQKIVDLVKQIKPYIIHFLDSSALLKLWIQILIPQVEDFKAELSLQIQEDSLAEIRTIESEVAAYLDHIYKYYADRAKLVSKFAKYPHISDYKQSVCELDERMFMNIRLISLELRNHYTTVHDVLVKNLEKIKKPRQNTHIAAMY